MGVDMRSNIEISNLISVQPVFRFADLSYSYPGSSSGALEHVDLAVNPGETFALLGPNGAGKTTLLRILCGRLSANSGTLRISENFRRGNALDLSKCGILLENPGVYPKLSIGEYLKFFADFYSTKNVSERIRSLANRLELPDVSTPMGKLSLGTRQKVQVARALVHSPGLLLLDEPVANLDPSAREAVWEILGEWKKNFGGTLVVCSHVLSEMERFATSFAILYKGRVLLSESVGNLRTNEFTVDVRIPDGVSPESLKTGFPPTAQILSVSPKRLSLEAVYRDSIRAFSEEK